MLLYGIRTVSMYSPLGALGGIITVAEIGAGTGLGYWSRAWTRGMS